MHGGPSHFDVCAREGERERLQFHLPVCKRMNIIKNYLLITAASYVYECLSE